jgi:hypothetical protein
LSLVGYSLEASCVETFLLYETAAVGIKEFNPPKNRTGLTDEQDRLFVQPVCTVEVVRIVFVGGFLLPSYYRVSFIRKFR